MSGGDVPYQLMLCYGGVNVLSDLIGSSCLLLSGRSPRTALQVCDENLRQLLVHPKDKIQPDNKCNVIYEIPCCSCNKVYIGETGRCFHTRREEHQIECEKETTKRHTRSEKEKAHQENLKSAISDHCKRHNHIMNWEEARVIRAEENRFQRWILEAVEIRKRAERTINRDEGAYALSHTWSAVLGERPDSRRRELPVKLDRTFTPP